jgi:hypothetical protein
VSTAAAAAAAIALCIVVLWIRIIDHARNSADQHMLIDMHNALLDPRSLDSSTGVTSFSVISSLSLQLLHALCSVLCHTWHYLPYTWRSMHCCRCCCCYCCCCCCDCHPTSASPSSSTCSCSCCCHCCRCRQITTPASRSWASFTH